MTSAGSRFGGKWLVRRVTLGLLWCLALALAGWTLRQLPLNDIASQLALLAPRDWMVWSLVNAAILFIAVKRWQVIARALMTPLSLVSLFRLRQAGSAVSFLTPGPHFGGEPLQLYWLRRHCQTPLYRAVAILGLDRFMETATNISVLLAGVLMLLGAAMLDVQEWLQVSATLAGVLCVMCLSLALVLRHPDWLARRLRPLAARLQGRRETDHQGQRGEGQSLKTLLGNILQWRQPTLWLALLLSLLGWVALLAELALLLDFLGLTPSAVDIVLIMVGMRLAMLLPVPGGIGTIEASLLWSFQHLGLTVSAAVGLIALIRLRDALILLLGVACLLSFSRPGRVAAPVSAE